MNLNEIKNVLQEHVPASALQYCIDLWINTPFKFHLRKKRLTKAGDFTCKAGNEPQITINHDLPPLEFLITYVHEVAHLHVHKKLGWKVEPHGMAWKQTFQRLLIPLLNSQVFPEPVLSILDEHMKDPMASTYSDGKLSFELRKVNPLIKNAAVLSDLPEGSVFDFQGRWFKKGKIKRTRFLCLEIKSKRQYLVPADAPVGNAQLTIF